MEKDPTKNDLGAQDNALSEEELEAIAGGAMPYRPKATREEQNQMIVEFYKNKGMNVTLEQVSDSRTLLDIVHNPSKYQ